MTFYSFSVESIQGGSIGTAEVKIAGFLFQNRTYDLYNTAMHRVGLKCPVAAGKYSVNMTAPIPVITPRVSVRSDDYVLLEHARFILLSIIYMHLSLAFPTRVGWGNSGDLQSTMSRTPPLGRYQMSINLSMAKNR